MADTRTRFAAKVDRSSDTDCHVWIGAKTPAGYGKIKDGPQFRYAHHLALEYDGRARPDGAIALHLCNNPSCVNPSHLRWGTQADNMQQAIREGRAPHVGRVAGERNGNAKLTADDVRAIRSDPRGGSTVARDYGVTPALITSIRAGRAWRHV